MASSPSNSGRGQRRNPSRTGSSRTGSSRTGSSRTGSSRTGSSRTASSRTGSSSASAHPHSSGIVPGTEVMFELARKVSSVAKAPVVGGVAAMLHGCGRTTRDIDIYAEDFWRTHEHLEAAGYLWNSDRREHVTPEGVPVHMVGADELGGVPKRQSTIRGVKVISLADLVRAKLVSGLESPRRAKDIADVLELIRVVPLKKDFAAKLPTKLRSAFKQLVDDVHEPRRTTRHTTRNTTPQSAPRTTPRSTLDIWKHAEPKAVRTGATPIKRYA